ncbi:MAG: hypothetical protein ACYDBS_06265, partial [Acidimicrobiales bacterium]
GTAGSRRSAAARALEAKRRRRRIWIASFTAVVVVVAGVGLGLALTGSPSGSSRAGHRTGRGHNPGHKLTLRSLSSLGHLRPAPSPGPIGPEGV